MSQEDCRQIPRSVPSAPAPSLPFDGRHVSKSHIGPVAVANVPHMTADAAVRDCSERKERKNE